MVPTHKTHRDRPPPFIAVRRCSQQSNSNLLKIIVYSTVYAYPLLAKQCLNTLDPFEDSKKDDGSLVSFYSSLDQKRPLYTHVMTNEY